MATDPQLQLSQQTIKKIMEYSRPALKKRADQIARKARALTTKNKVAGTVTRESGTRPKGRPYERVVHSNKSQEYGVYGRKRYRILGRAAGL